MSFEPGSGDRPLDVAGEVDRYDELETQKLVATVSIDFSSDTGPSLVSDSQATPQYGFFTAVRPNGIDEDEVAELVAIERQMDNLSVYDPEEEQQFGGTMYLDHEIFGREFISFGRTTGEIVSSDPTFLDNNTDFANSARGATNTNEFPGNESFVQTSLGVSTYYKDSSNSTGGGAGPQVYHTDPYLWNFRNNFGRGPLAANTRNLKSALQWGAEWDWQQINMVQIQHKAVYKFYWDVFEMAEQPPSAWEMIES